MSRDFGPWFRAVVCHCGQHKQDHGEGACTACGCSDKFKTVTVRYEWEYRFFHRKYFIVEWDGCTHDAAHREGR